MGRDRRLKGVFTNIAKCIMFGALCVLTMQALGAHSAHAATTSVADRSIERLVASAITVNTLKGPALSALQSASSDFDWYDNHIAGKCMYLNSCVAGDLSSKKTIVLYGDSHAVMWMPAIVPYATTHHFRVNLVWLGMCPAAQVDVYGPKLGYPSGCNHYRSSIIGQITRSKPALVLVAEKTSAVRHEEAVYFSSSAQWQQSLTNSLLLLRSHGTIPVAVVEDTPFFPWSIPTCLSQHQRAIQKCSVPYPSSLFPGMQVAEKNAASATGSSFISTVPWLCQLRCPGVIGSNIAYVDGAHLSRSYARFLAPNFGARLNDILATSSHS